MHQELADRIRWTLERLSRAVAAGQRDGWIAGAATDARAPAPPAPAAAIGSPMSKLARLGLARVQVDLLWMLACVELDPGLARAAQVLVTPGMQELNPVAADQLIAAGDDERAPHGLDALVRLGLVELATGAHLPLYRRTLRASDRVLDLARGVWGLDREIARVARIVVAHPGEGGNVAGALVAHGLPGSGRVAALLARIPGRRALIADGAALARDRDTQARQLRILAREARLHEAALVLRDLDQVDAALVDAVVDLPILGTAREPQQGTAANVAVALPDTAARTVLWRAALPALTSADADTIAARYTVPPGVIEDAAAAATAAEPVAIHAALRDRLERGLVGIATRIEVRQTWADLVLPDDQLDLIEELVGRVRCRAKVLDTWGFAAKVGRGTGLTALFSGPPGTGKTMVAGLIAKELGLDLYQIDLSKIVSKYIGETEKQLASVFDAAEAGHAILLFDEADSLFGKRSEVRSSNDRYANLETNYLLQRIEQFTGITLLTTNHESAIDPAFQRRLSIHLRVPLPDEDQRARLWQAMIPERAERTAEIAFAELAKDFVMSGGYIKNAVLRAAYGAAATGKAISHAHLRRAARVEYEAMGKLVI